jgi:hypothetical protein
MRIKMLQFHAIPKGNNCMVEYCKDGTFNVDEVLGVQFCRDCLAVEVDENDKVLWDQRIENAAIAKKMKAEAKAEKKRRIKETLEAEAKKEADRIAAKKARNKEKIEEARLAKEAADKAAAEKLQELKAAKKAKEVE